MAATDQHYRSQKALDVVFGASCVALLLSTFWMMYVDHYRPYKNVQRDFRDVEEAVSQRVMTDAFPQGRMEEVERARADLVASREVLKEEKAKVGDSLRPDALAKARLEAQYQDRKAVNDSEVSLLNIAIDDRDAAPPGPKKDALDKVVDEKRHLLQKLEGELQDLQRKIAEIDGRMEAALYGQKKAEESVGRAEDLLKRLTGPFDRAAKAAAQKKWWWGDNLRSWPILDGFASAYKIQQISLDHLTIDYGGFKDVPRYDRCTTCHLGIERAGYTKDALAKIGEAADGDKYANAVAFLKDRAKTNEDLQALGFNPNDLRGSLLTKKLSPAEVKQYCAHPRLDLFVDSNSPHPAEKFGCSTCHAGQGSATEFGWASHSPNDVRQKETWTKDNGWFHNEYWEFPMLPSRFVESGCLKCHHQVTDLVRHGSKEEAPKLLKGYNLVRENGCFGCHEIAGLKAGRAVGPDMRLEPWPPLDALRPDEKAAALADANNPPGTLRKVGPSLRRLAEKTNEEWTRKWIRSPRGFRPDTRMPHFYDLSTNSPDALPDEQKKFPAAEIHSLAHYLFAESTAYLDRKDTTREGTKARIAALKARGRVDGDKEVVELNRRLERLDREQRPKVEAEVVDGNGGRVTVPDALQDDKARQEAVLNGRRLFTERGCLACHAHQGTETAANQATPPVAAVASEADFGPNLSRLAAKIDKTKGRRWLVQWVLNPNVHFPRTRMPVTHLTADEAAQVADWLLSQEVKDYAEPDVQAPDLETLKELARVYLRKAPKVSPLEVDDVLAKGFSQERTADGLMEPDADEQVLKGEITADKLKYYIGKKSVSRLGCFGCHDIPGFETAKPIGTPLNDWGKKDPARLAFEDAAAFVHDTYHLADLRDDPENPARPADGWQVKGGKRPFEKYFEEMLHHGHLSREGFLHLKLMEPRSYDYHRSVKWDDRLRMPQFRFAYTKKRDGESDADFAARAEKEEAEGREAVMTFVLGLVAEPVNPKYVHNPAPDRAAEVKGRQVLDKFNCAGCHQVRPGLYELKLGDPDAFAALKKAHNLQNYADDFDDLKAHNAWSAAQTQSGEKATALGFPPRKQNEDEGRFEVRLTHALRVADPAGGQPFEFRAGSRLILPAEAYNAPQRVQPYGGELVEKLMPYLSAKDRTLYGLDQTNQENQNARAALPPPLVREGEKVQPEWLFRFLKEPDKIRPLTVLRMPRFNLSDEDAQALVNYFNGADRATNPGIGLTYPYFPVPQREESYWRHKSKAYAASLGQAQVEARVKGMRPVWERAAKDQLAEAEQRLAAARTASADAEKRVAAAKAANKPSTDEESAKKRADQEIAETGKLIDELKNRIAKGDYAAYRARYLETELYATDAHRLLADRAQSLCLQCHRVGSAIPEKEQGPALEQVFERMRPDWVERWIAEPNRLLTYSSVMPQNFKKTENKLQNLFVGDSRRQIEALRDVLLNYPKVTEMPGVRYGFAPDGEK